MRTLHIQSGFTLLELLTTAVVAILLATFAIPGMVELVSRNRMVAQSNEIVGALRLARNLAVTNGTPVSICASSHSDRCATGQQARKWSHGWIVFTDDNGDAGSIDEGDAVLRVYPALTGGNELSASTPFIRYRPDGFLDGAAATLFLSAAKCTLADNRNISVTAQGLASVAHAAC
jgi:type IV fimbrial biogenesis protein FimT